MSDEMGLLELLWEGFTMIGEAITGFIKALLGLCHVTVEDWMIQFAVVVLLLIAVWKYGKHAPKLLLIILFLILASTIVNAFFG